MNTEDRLAVARGVGLGWTKWVKRVRRYKLHIIKYSALLVSWMLDIKKLSSGREGGNECGLS